MDDLEIKIEQKATDLVEGKPINKLLDEKIESADDMKNALDLLTTKTALKQKGTVEILVEEKNEELKNDAAARRIQAETERISKEVEKVKQEKEKQLVELDKVIAEKRKEVEELRSEGDKAQAFFDSNKEILEYVGCKSKKTLRVMFFLMIPATFVFMIVRFLALPFTISGKLIEGIIDTVVGICKKISNNALKIVIAIVVIMVIVACGFLAYFYGGKLIGDM